MDVCLVILVGVHSLFLCEESADASQACWCDPGCTSLLFVCLLCCLMQRLGCQSACLFHSLPGLMQVIGTFKYLRPVVVCVELLVVGLCPVRTPTS
ncbi:hypothetical protein BKA57DRAFT_476709 [Linnemannia elongata]|nr:hypothetical protein BKA57DRAFT_476709 [Linnemannia elongata]